MNFRVPVLLAIFGMLGASLADVAAAQGKVYRWVDEKGVVHFGDAIPPEYSRERHEILDGRGTRTTVHDEAPKAPQRDPRDRALLASYGSVADIEAVRDRRLGYLVAQNEVASDRLEALRIRRQALADNPAALNELATVEQRIVEYDAEIERRNLDIARIREEFDSDIARFRELRRPESKETAALTPER
jgi:DNA gyrase/topoisomerase IV subunit A